MGHNHIKHIFTYCFGITSQFQSLSTQKHYVNFSSVIFTLPFLGLQLKKMNGSYQCNHDKNFNSLKIITKIIFSEWQSGFITYKDRPWQIQRYKWFNCHFHKLWTKEILWIIEEESIVIITYSSSSLERKIM